MNHLKKNINKKMISFRDKMIKKKKILVEVKKKKKKKKKKTIHEKIYILLFYYYYILHLTTNIYIFPILWGCNQCSQFLTGRKQKKIKF